MKKFVGRDIDFGTPEFYSFREEYLTANFGREKMEVLIKYGIVAAHWKELIIPDLSH